MRRISPNTQERVRNQAIEWKSPHLRLIDKVGILEADRVIKRLRAGLSMARKLAKDLGAEDWEMLAWGCSASEDGVTADYYSKDHSVALWLHFPESRTITTADLFEFPQLAGYFSPVKVKFRPGPSVYWRGV